MYNVLKNISPPECGLSDKDARESLARYGPNEVVPNRLPWRLSVRVLRELRDPLVPLGIAAAGTYLVLGNAFDAVVIFTMLLPLVALNEILANRVDFASRSLRKLLQITVRVRRGSSVRVIPATEVVPGDIVLLEEGDAIVADGELVEGTRVRIDDSAFTGLSIPLVRFPTGDENGRLLFAGTKVLSGNGAMRAMRTGKLTKFAGLGRRPAAIDDESTPLEHLIKRGSFGLALAVLVLACGLTALTHSFAYSWPTAFLVGLSFAMAGLGGAATRFSKLYITLGACKLAERKALVRKRASVETLGAIGVICSDKGGLLTLGRLEVAGKFTAQACSERVLLETALKACARSTNDPAERAIAQRAFACGINLSKFYEASELAYEDAFDPAAQCTTHVWVRNGIWSLVTKGAPPAILEKCALDSRTRASVIEVSQGFAKVGMRVLAVATREIDRVLSRNALQVRDLEFIGLLAFSETLRSGVVDDVRTCQEAGIRVITMSGDSSAAAGRAAHAIGLVGIGDRIISGTDMEAMTKQQIAEVVATTNVFVQTQPHQKLQIVSALAAAGTVVAMTGRETQDVLALEAADLGIAMGKRSAAFARAEADVLVLDDRFGTIIDAVRGARGVLGNVRRMLCFLAAFQLPMLALVLLPPLVGAPPCLLPVHMIVLFLNARLIAWLVFEKDPEPGNLMRQAPCLPRASLLIRSDWLCAGLLGATLAGGISVLYLSLCMQSVSLASARSITIVALLLAQLILVLCVRTSSQPLWRSETGWNPRILPVLIGIPILLGLAFWTPIFKHAVHLAGLSATQFALAIAVALAATLWLEPFKRVGTPRLSHRGSRSVSNFGTG